MSADAGWYPDPRDGSTGVRWWDGEQWTSWLADSADAPAPDPAQSEPAQSDPAETTDEEAETVAAARTVRLPVAVAATVAAVVLALLAVGATVTATSQTVVSGPAVAPPTPVALPTVSYESGTRTARAAGLSLVLPAEPWDCNTNARKIEKYFSSAIACSAVTHEKFNGTDNSYANVVIGLIDPSLVENSVPGTAQRLFRQVQTNLFRSPTTLTDNTSTPAGIGPTESVWRFQGRLNYTSKGLGKRYDEVRVVVAELPDGQYAAMIFNVIDDAPTPIRRAMDASVSSLSYR